METFTRGEEVEVSTGGIIWEKRTFICEIKGARCPFICVWIGEEESFKEGKPFDTCTWQYIRKINKPKELTMERLQELLGYEVKIVK